MCASRFVCSAQPSQKLRLLSVARAVWAPPYLPPHPPLPRASFPVPLSLPAAASLDFVSDFPRKGLCGGHGVKNTTFLMHSLGTPDPEAAPSLRAGLTCCLSYLPQPVTPFLFRFKKFLRASSLFLHVLAHVA